MCFADNRYYLLVADRKLNNIYQVNVENGKAREILPRSTAKHPLAVAFDRNTNVIYWIECTANATTIRGYSLREHKIVLTKSHTIRHESKVPRSIEYPKG